MRRLFLLLAAMLPLACRPAAEPPNAGADALAARVDQYHRFRLTAPLDSLSAADRAALPLLIEAAQQMDAIFWRQAYGDPDTLLGGLADPSARRYAEINYGPWDRLDGNAPFLPGVGPKPPGAGFYPPDLTPEALEAAAAVDPALKSEYTMVRRAAGGGLEAVPYHVFFAEPTERAATLLEQAANRVQDAGLKRYLTLRARALRTDDYRESDLAWMDMKDNTLDLVIGPIEHYEDQLAGAKAAHEAYVLVKDRAWSRRLARYAALLPMLQRGLPVPDAYKRETPGADSDLGAYDALYYAGDANAGSKTIAINLPNDEQVQLLRGTRRLQLKNSMRAKFDAILTPIAGALIAENQRRHVTFDAFFGNTMFHEVAHGLGIKNTLDGRGTVRAALRDRYSALEEGKADVLGLYMVGALHKAGEYDADLMDHYTTFLAGIFRSVRFGGASAHGQANLMRFNFFREQGAFTRDADGLYRVEPAAFEKAIGALSEQILRLQGDGSYEAVQTFAERYGAMDPALQKDLDRLGAAGIPVDIVFEQGWSVLESGR